MHPILELGGVLHIPTYAFFVGLAFLVAGWVRRRDAERAGLARDPRMLWVNLGALLGAVVGAKVGMVLFIPLSSIPELVAAMGSLDFTGKTVVGALGGGFLGVELAKKWVGVTRTTGDAWAVALPLGQAIGRVGCFFQGCCYGMPTSLAYGVDMAGATRHPVQLLEALLDLTLAGLLSGLRGRGWPEGLRFRAFLCGYAWIRFSMEALRGDPAVTWGALKAVQWVCLLAGIGFGFKVWRGLYPAREPG